MGMVYFIPFKKSFGDFVKQLLACFLCRYLVGVYGICFRQDNFSVCINDKGAIFIGRFVLVGFRGFYNIAYVPLCFFRALILIHIVCALLLYNGIFGCFLAAC